jgi:hypothetical protein
MKNILPLPLLLILLISCDDDRMDELIGSSWRFEQTTTRDYKVGLDGTIRFPGSPYRDDDTLTTVTFNTQIQISFLTEDKARYNSYHRISTNQISMNNQEIYNSYTYKPKTKTGTFHYWNFSIKEDTLFLWVEDSEIKSEFINISDVKIR